MANSPSEELRHVESKSPCSEHQHDSQGGTTNVPTQRDTYNVSSQFTLARNYVSTSLLGRLMFRAEKTHSKAWDITESAGTRGSSLSHKYTPDLWNLVQAPRAAMHSFNQQASQSSSVSLEGEERKGGLLWKEQIDRASYIDFV